MTQPLICNLRSFPRTFSRTFSRTFAPATIATLALAVGLTLCLGVNVNVRAEDAPAGPKINYDEHIKPIFREHCLKCHNDNMQKGGLALDNYGATMVGGASGEVIYAEDVESSRLFALVNHDEKPVMPPNSDRIADEKVALLKQWIEQGALENSGSKKTAAKKKPNWEFKPVANDAGPGAMPENWLRQPVTTTSRAAQIASLACSPRSPLVAISGHRQVSLYHTETSELLGVAPFPEGVPYIVRFSRDGSLMMVGGGRAAHSGIVALYDVKTGQRVAQVGDELDAVMTADVDANLRSIAIGDTSKLVKIFDIGTGETKFQMKKHTDWVTAVSFSPDGKWLATGDRAGGLVLWEAETGREYMVFDGHGMAITSISWRADSTVFATSSEDNNIRTWNRENNKAIKNWGAHGGGASWVEFANDGMLVSVGRDRQAKFWDGNGAGKQNFAKLADIGLRVAISHDSKRVFMGDWAGNVKISHVDKPDHVGDLRSNPQPIDAQLASARNVLTERQKAADAAAQKKLAVDLQVVDSTKKRDEAVQQLATIEKSVQELQAQGNTLRQQLKQLDAQLNQKKTKIEPAKVAMNNMENALKTVTESVTAVVTQTQTEIQARDRQATVVQQLEANERMFAERKTKLASDVATHEKQVAELRPQLEKSQTDLTAVREKIKAAGEKPDPADQQREKQVNEQIAKLTTDIESAEQSLTTAQQSLAFFTDAYGK